MYINTNYENRVVCFLDILGFRKHVAETLNQDGNEDPDGTNKLISAFNLIREVLDIDRPECRKGTEVTQFSDSVVISFEENQESGIFLSLLNILHVQINLVQRGILCRGGVARGKLVHTDKILFGPALVDAHELESKTALYPRVILDSSIISLGSAAHARQHSVEYERKSLLSLLERDFDGMYYINYVTGARSELDDPELDYPGYLFALQEINRKGITEKDQSVVGKHKWLCGKLNPHIQECKEWASKALPQWDEQREAFERIPDR